MPFPALRDALLAQQAQETDRSAPFRGMAHGDRIRPCQTKCSLTAWSLSPPARVARVVCLPAFGAVALAPEPFDELRSRLDLVRRDERETEALEE